MKIYIGDAVYVEYQLGNIVLTTEDGIRTTNRIVLEPQVLRSFLRFLKKEREKVHESTE